jgi:hypothetical protein
MEECSDLYENTVERWGEAVDQSTLDVFVSIGRQIDQYDNNLRKIAQLDAEDARILSEACYAIFTKKQDIIDTLENNRQYLSFLPSASILSNVIDDLNNDSIRTIEQVKLLQQLLDAIVKHEDEDKKNLNSSKNTNVFARFTRLVREECEDVN